MGIHAKTQDHRNPLLLAASFVVVVAGIKAAGPLLTPLLVSTFLAILCIPAMRRLEAWGLPQALSLTVVIVMASILVLVITFVIGSSVRGFESQLPHYQQRITSLISNVGTWLSTHGINVDGAELAKRLDGGRIMTLVAGTASGILAAFSNVLLIVLTMLFILVEANSLQSKLGQFMDNSGRDRAQLGRASEQIHNYLSAKALVSLGTGICVGILCAACGVDFPLVWAMLAFLFNFVPNIGSIIAAVPAVLLTLIDNGTGNAAIVALGYIAINMVIGNVIEPKLLGRRLGLSTLVVFVSMIFWGWVWGPVGMLLSVPITVIVKIMMEQSDSFRDIAFLLGPADEPIHPAGESVG